MVPMVDLWLGQGIGSGTAGALTLNGRTTCGAVVGLRFTGGLKGMGMMVLLLGLLVEVGKAP